LVVAAGEAASAVSNILAWHASLTRMVGTGVAVSNDPPRDLHHIRLPIG
jgi:hypothetical protein